MAHITVQLICYKLGEGWAKMADAAASWYDKVDWDDHVLDILLFGWIGWAAFLYFTLNSLGSLIGPLQRVQPVDRLLPASTHAVAAAHHTGKESCLWLNTALNWFYLHYYHPPEFIDVWVQSLNDQVQKLGGPVQIKFERIHQGSLPPKFSDVLYEAAPEDKYTITCHLESRDLAFDVFASQQTHEGVKLTNCTATVLRMKGTLQVSSFKEGLAVKIRAAFMGKPEIKLKLQPSNPYQDPEDLVDLGAVESVIRNAIALATTTIDITPLLMPDGYVPSPVRDRPGSGRGGGSMRSGGGDAFQFQPPPNHSPRPAFDQHQQHGQQGQGQQGQGQGHGHALGKVDASPLQAVSAPKTAASAKPLPPSQTLFEPIEASEYQSAFSAPSYSVPPKPPRMYGDKRLLVKVIKANGLGPRDFGGIDPICFVLMDDPPQNHTTSAVKNSVNPFWDEHFLFDVAQSSRELHFEIYAKNKALGEDFLGQATLYVEDLRRTPSSRQILTLQGRPGTMDNVTGSLTAEFLLMEPAEADALLAGNQFTPRRRIEVDRMVTPSGTVVTTTTTTTEKPQFPHSAANDEQWGYGPDMAMNVPTIESSPTEDTPDMSYSSEKPHSPPEKDKKKSGFGGGFFKRFRKKRSQSADRSAHSLREGYLRPPEPSYGPQSKDDLELVRARQDAAASPSLKKSRSLGGSLKKLFRRSRKRSRTGGETSRESSLSRSSARHPASQGPSRDSSLTRHQPSPRATSVS